MQNQQSWYRVNEARATETPDLAQALRGEQGRFKVSVAHAQVFLVECAPGHSIKSLIPIGYQPTVVIERQPEGNATEQFEQQQTSQLEAGRR